MYRYYFDFNSTVQHKRNELNHEIGEKRERKRNIMLINETIARAETKTIPKQRHIDVSRKPFERFGGEEKICKQHEENNLKMIISRE